VRVVKPINFNSLSFERDSTATFDNSSGTLQTAPVDVLRLGYNPETLAYIGPIFEAAQTNLLLHSNDFTQSQWAKLGGTTITGGAAVSPDGLTNASRIQAGNIAIRQTFSTGTFTNIASSVYFKIESPPAYPVEGDNLVTITSGLLGVSGALIQIRVYSNHDPVVNAFGNSYHIQKRQNGWYRACIFRTGSTDFFTIQCGMPLLVYGAMAEQITGAFSAPSSYILSGASLGVRAADIQNSPPSVSSSNIPELDNPEWNNTTAYSAGTVVTVLGNYNRNYRCLNTISFLPAQTPYLDTTNWQDIGATNRWRMFDNKVGSDLQTSLTGKVDVTLSVASRVSTVALFNLQGDAATVRMFYDGGVIYEKTVNLKVNVAEPGWWSFWFGEKRQVKVVAFTDLPPAIPSSVQIIVDAGSGTAAIGKAVVGFGRDIGFIEYGTTSAGIIDYSTKEVDSFGNYFFQLRRFVDAMDLRVVVEPGQEDTIKATLAEARAQPYVYIGAEGRESLIILGRYIDFNILFSTPAASYCTARFEGL